MEKGIPFSINAKEGDNMEFEFITKINNEYNDMTKTFKKVAEYILKNHLQIPFMSIQEVSDAVEVSTATIHRFCISLGFTGFSAFQKEIQIYMQKNLTENENETYKQWDEEGPGILQNQIEINTVVLNEMFTDDLNNKFNETVQELLGARRIYILGLRASHGCAVLLYYLLKEYMDNVTLLTIGADDVYDNMISVGEGDVLLSIGFKAYTKYTVDIIRHFRLMKGKTISITDKYSSPLSQYSDISLIPGNSTPSYGFVMAVTLVKAISVAVIKQLSPEIIKRHDDMRELLLDNDIYM